jgi:pyridoxine 5-phosphate synthase
MFKTYPMLGIGSHLFELYTEHYARALDTRSFEHELLQYCAAAEVALDLGLEVNADHDLNLQYIVAFKERIP